MKIDANVRRAAVETAQLAAIFGSENAAEEALLAAANQQDRVTIQRIADAAREACLGEAADMDPGVAWILSWFAEQVEKMLGADGQQRPYTPGDGDVVQLTLTGVLTAYEVSHSSMPGGKDTCWELDTSEGIMIPLTADDFGTLAVTRLLAGG